MFEGETNKQRKINLTPILESARRPETGAAHYMGLNNPPFDKGLLNQQILNDAKEHFEKHQDVVLSYPINNDDRSVGASLAGYIASQDEQLDYNLELNFKGVAGQSFGVWNHRGMYLNLKGDANDYVGKGMSGGRISVCPPDNIQYVASRGAIIGNTCLYGASGGALFAAGQAGERFAVRNSGATAVVEGVGDHGCEYMTGGIVIILGPVGENFAAGMTGGKAVILDLNDNLQQQTNMESVEIIDMNEVESAEDENLLHSLLLEHISNTNSRWTQKIVDNFEHYLNFFKMVSPLSSNTDAISQQAKEEYTKAVITNIRVVR